LAVLGWGAFLEITAGLIIDILSLEHKCSSEILSWGGGDGEDEDHLPAAIKELPEGLVKQCAIAGSWRTFRFSILCNFRVAAFSDEMPDKLVMEIEASFCATFDTIPGFELYEDLGDNAITVQGEVLKKAKEIPFIDEGICKTIWINVKVPEDAKKGTYKGKITFTPSGKQSKDIDVEVKVLPFQLMQPPAEVMSWSPIMAGTWEFEELEKELSKKRKK